MVAKERLAGIAKAFAIAVSVIGIVIVFWGLFTDWTFSGPLPGKGASSAGDTCIGDDANGVYKYNTSGVCTLDSCVTGYKKSGISCTKITQSACDPTTTKYDSVQEDKCLNEDNEIVDCTTKGPAEFKDITFKSSCGTTDIVNKEFDLGIYGCNTPDAIQGHCSNIAGCIGYRTFGNDCKRLLLNAAPSCAYSSDQIYIEQKGKDIGDQGEITDGQGLKALYLNPSCFNSTATRYETWGDNPMQPIGGGCNSDINTHFNACSKNSACVGFRLFDNGCSHFLRKKNST